MRISSNQGAAAKWDGWARLVDRAAIVSGSGIPRRSLPYSANVSLADNKAINPVGKRTNRPRSERFRIPRSFGGGVYYYYYRTNLLYGEQFCQDYHSAARLQD
ncbi:hypothetical protein HRR83_001710 [Exophiala dermatitidis]|nr:hypothetical protein HRR73_004844 [Exophiala dermatitidis]KAJ4526516.1 hypothetical protein HRR74_001714 [Exophiala dermatitidis]KAJ4532237.1 hypothetical protein HRR76_007236 [Exophiala dermatitidis]KAJ4546273.1 hypothetical protein HRR77_004809 [Exophiala dermatitidis]KAJ4567484.1 hypothetical protein HRR79_004998 [Exophiala dermatitidis]